MKKRPTVFPAQAGSGRLGLSEDDSYERGAVLWAPAAQGVVGRRGGCYEEGTCRSYGYSHRCRRVPPCFNTNPKADEGSP